MIININYDTDLITFTPDTQPIIISDSEEPNQILIDQHESILIFKSKANRLDYHRQKGNYLTCLACLNIRKHECNCSH